MAKPVTLIIGAGCAGLSLAERLVTLQAVDGPLILLDQKKTYSRDRTWCFWDVHSHPFEEAVDRSWSRWSVSAGGQKEIYGDSQYVYAHLSSERFYDLALRRISQHPAVSLRLGVSVGDVIPVKNKWSVSTSQGEILADRVFDSRPEPKNTSTDPKILPPPGSVHWVQHFLGQKLRSEKPIFDPGVVTLLDFDGGVSHQKGVHFMYVLPFDAHTALVEDTYFGDSSLNKSLYRQSIKAYLEDEFKVYDYEVEWEEVGSIPMSTKQTTTVVGSNYLRIGVGGGNAKPSTGYAFLSIQRHSQRIAEAVKSGGQLSDLKSIRSHLGQSLDVLFLCRLQANPSEAGQLFSGLFRGAKDDALIRFLSDVPTAKDYAQVMGALPTLPMLQLAAKKRNVWWPHLRPAMPLEVS